MLIAGKPTISKACSNAACLEATLLEHGAGVQVRDTKDGGESLVIPLGDWRAFVADLRVYARDADADR